MKPTILPPRDERHSDQGRKARVVKVWERLNWPQVAALALVLAGLLGVAHALPAEFWARVDWVTVGSFIASLLGVGGLAGGGRMFRSGEE